MLSIELIISNKQIRESTVQLVFWIYHPRENIIGRSMSTLQNSSCMATYHLSWKLSKLDKPDMRDTVGEVRMNS